MGQGRVTALPQWPAYNSVRNLERSRFKDFHFPALARGGRGQQISLFRAGRECKSFTQAIGGLFNEGLFL